MNPFYPSSEALYYLDRYKKIDDTDLKIIETRWKTKLTVDSDDDGVRIYLTTRKIDLLRMKLFENFKINLSGITYIIDTKNYLKKIIENKKNKAVLNKTSELIYTKIKNEDRIRLISNGLERDAIHPLLNHFNIEYALNRKIHEALFLSPKSSFSLLFPSSRLEITNSYRKTYIKLLNLIESNPCHLFRMAETLFETSKSGSEIDAYGSESESSQDKFDRSEKIASLWKVREILSILSCGYHDPSSSLSNFPSEVIYQLILKSCWIFINGLRLFKCH